MLGSMKVAPADMLMLEGECFVNESNVIQSIEIGKQRKIGINTTKEIYNTKFEFNDPQF